MKNIWKSFYNINVQEPCSFYAEYTGDALKMSEHKQNVINETIKRRSILTDCLFTEPMFAR